MGSLYSPLTFEERRKIDQWHDAKMPVPEIADRLGRASSTISRELQRKLISNPELKAAVEDRL
ncbi:helix-turn-helix domain-containing protein [Paracoccus seriniphilus]|uniref:helix-turn-helix domain-containing protein n=1 Tax=Paracoccus seriniphilus TaxID=184748 RepID=UPI003567C3AB